MSEEQDGAAREDERLGPIKGLSHRGCGGSIFMSSADVPVEQIRPVCSVHGVIAPEEIDYDMPARMALGIIQETKRP